MNRVDIAQAILDALGDGSYLEIGVLTGSSFVPIRAKRKWGVDPAYAFSRRRIMKYELLSSLGIKTERLFKMASDDFFIAKKKMLTANGISVCLVDGLHTYDQSLKDVLNALDYLKPGGVMGALLAVGGERARIVFAAGRGE